MKNLRTAVLCACMACCSVVAFAQETIPINEPDLNKPRLFSSLADRITVNTADLDHLFDLSPGRTASLNLSADGQTKLEGEVLSLSARTSGLQTVIVRSSNFNGARLTISRRDQADGTVTYTGRIISFAAGDLYELKNEQGQWLLVKRNFYDLVNE